MESLNKDKSLFVLEGIVFIILGVLAILLPFVTTMLVALIVGWLFLIGGVTQLYHGFYAQPDHGRYSWLLTGIIYVIIAILMLSSRTHGLLFLAIVLSVYFILTGITTLILALQLTMRNHWPLLALNALVSFILLAFLWIYWPVSAFWMIGLLAGINLIAFGISILCLHQNWTIDLRKENIE